jgi:hypothetical protein
MRGTRVDNPDSEWTTIQMKYQPTRLLRMFIELGKDAQEELEHRAIESWSASRAESKVEWKERECEEQEWINNPTDVIV